MPMSQGEMFEIPEEGIQTTFLGAIEARIKP